MCINGMLECRYVCMYSSINNKAHWVYNPFTFIWHLVSLKPLKPRMSKGQGIIYIISIQNLCIFY